MPPASAAEQPSDTLAKPLSTLVGRLAEKPALTAKDCAEMAGTTITYGERVKSAQQHPPEPVVRDALQAVALGEKLDAKAADWPQLRQKLEDLLKRDDQQNQDQQKQEQQQQQQEQQKQDQQQQQNEQQNQDEQKQDQQQEQQPQSQPQNQDAFGDMKEQQEQKPQNQEPKPQTPPPGTQKVGGQKEEKSPEQADPELAMPLQKLEQVRNQDSPAKLQQLMQGKQQKPKGTAKDW